MSVIYLVIEKVDGKDLGYSEVLKAFEDYEPAYSYMNKAALKRMENTKHNKVDFGKNQVVIFTDMATIRYQVQVKPIEEK